MFTVERLLRLAPNAPADTVDNLAAVLEARAIGFGLNTPRRIAHFIAQICHESGGFSKLVESLDYSEQRIGEVWPRLKSRAPELAHNPEALADAAYGDRLGNEEPGDGWKYRGRGFIQITGKNAYHDRSVDVGLHLMTYPDIAAEPPTAAVIALSFWRARGCNQAADTDSVERVTALINGPGLVGLEQRKKLTALAKTIFTIEDALVA